MLLFQKVRKTHEQFSRLKRINIQNTVIEIKATKNTLLTKNKVDVSTPGQSFDLRQNFITRIS